MEIITPKEYVGTIMELAQARRGEFIDMTYLTETRTTLIYDLPLAEVCAALASCPLPSAKMFPAHSPALSRISLPKSWLTHAVAHA